MLLLLLVLVVLVIRRRNRNRPRILYADETVVSDGTKADDHVPPPLDANQKPTKSKKPLFPDDKGATLKLNQALTTKRLTIPDEDVEEKPGPTDEELLAITNAILYPRITPRKTTVWTYHPEFWV